MQKFPLFVILIFDFLAPMTDDIINLLPKQQSGIITNTKSADLQLMAKTEVVYIIMLYGK